MEILIARIAQTWVRLPAAPPWRHRIMANTVGFRPTNPGSIPGGVTIVLRRINMDYKDCHDCHYLYSIDCVTYCVLANKLVSEVERCSEPKEEPNEIKFEIYFSDLNHEAQKQMIQTFGQDFVKEGNYDTFPLVEYVQYKDPGME